MFFQKIKNHSVILKNTGYLTIIEFLRLLMPFIALPYLITTVGPENYGTVIFAQTVVSYFSYFVNFGLDVSAVKEISVNRESRKKLSEIVCTVLGVKFTFFLISFLVLSIGLFFIPFGKAHLFLFYSAFLTCFSDVLFPTWFFQGIEKMKYLTVIRATSVFLYTGSIFIFIRIPEHFERIALLQSSCNLLAGCVSVFILVRIIRLRFFMPSYQNMKNTVKEAFPFFLSRISNFFNGSIAKLICGTFFSMHLVAAYDLMHKIAVGAELPVSMLNQAVYPHIAKSKSRLFTTKFFFVVMGISFFTSLCMFTLAPLANIVFANGSLPESVVLIKIAAFSAFFVGIDVYMGAPVLVSFGYPRPFNVSVYLATVVLVVTCAVLYLSNSITYVSFIIAILLSEIATTAYRFYYCLKYELIDFSLLRRK
ncbi:hypothetical protein B7988_06880 [Fibrobacter sp. UWB1]|uniref:oligosaccharide flippase family protein n=1 Tax=Fibrobacter sp. UWB1 TaxID=1964355 RepID=UPI000B527903|nr:oligosaccharide flippase family protein [Fibrobacter sp. UWB1]OWV26302.1 hypothetical protein B7988_06880 [Fibrobacter sp. UWB1]